MLAEVIRRLQRVANRSDEHGIRGSAEHREVIGQTRTDASDSRLVREGKSTRQRNTRRRYPVAPKTAIHHNVGDAEFGSPATPHWTERVLALGGADVTHRGTAAVYMLTTTSSHANTAQSSPPIHRNLFPLSSSSQHVSLEVTKIGRI